MSQGKAPYSTSEKAILLGLLKQFKDVIETKKTDGVTVRKKNETWEIIRDMYNTNVGFPRTTKQLRKCWENIKHKTKKNYAGNKKQMLMTVECPSPPVKERNPRDDLVHGIIPAVTLCIDNPWDSTGNYRRKIKDSLESKEAWEENILNQLPLKEELTETDDNSKNIPCTTHQLTEQEVENNVEELDDELENIKDHNSINKRKMQDRLSFLEEERQLRIHKLREDIRQQRELHAAKMEVVHAETLYWIRKLQIEKNGLSV